MHRRREQVTKDDDVRFFPPDSLSVVGHDLLERGFPADASSSQLVLVYEAQAWTCDSGRFPFHRTCGRKAVRAGSISPRAGDQEARPPHDAGHRSAAGWYKADGQGQAVLTIVRWMALMSQKKTRIAVDRILDWVKTDLPPAPPGLELAVTGSAVVGRDTNKAAGDSIRNTTYSTIILVVVILLVVYRSPLMALRPPPNDRALRVCLAPPDRPTYQRAGARVSGH